MKAATLPGLYGTSNKLTTRDGLLLLLLLLVWLPMLLMSSILLTLLLPLLLLGCCWSGVLVLLLLVKGSHDRLPISRCVDQGRQRQQQMQRQQLLASDGCSTAVVAMAGCWLYRLLVPISDQRGKASCLQSLKGKFFPFLSQALTNINLEVQRQLQSPTCARLVRQQNVCCTYSFWVCNASLKEDVSCVCKHTPEAIHLKQHKPKQQKHQ
jgi:hypothetical protein